MRLFRCEVWREIESVHAPAPRPLPVFIVGAENEDRAHDSAMAIVGNADSFLAEFTLLYDIRVTLLGSMFDEFVS